mmetsp:Transcript_904/g.932  ORF Transcript_904/g.932 Transcript_904/m.932 type:complete len:333 (-) Transcript_904:120-1118(-)|eukprot:gene2633-2799_t
MILGKEFGTLLIYVSLILFIFDVVPLAVAKEIKRNHHRFYLKDQDRKTLDATFQAWKQAVENKVNKTVPLLPNENFHPKQYRLKQAEQAAAPAPPKATGRKAIVTLLCGGGEQANTRYTRFLHAFAYTLRNAQYGGEVLVLYTDDFPIGMVQQTMERFHLLSKKVQLLSIPDTGHKYSKMLTKLHLWNLLEYEQIIYYDVDFIFQGNPFPAFADCGSMTPFCAVLDQGIRQMKNYEHKRSYFNAGFLVLKPSKETYQKLLSRQREAFTASFVEQDLLNAFFRDWKMLDLKYNLMHSYKLHQIDPQIVAVHEKLHELKRVFTDRKYIWNKLGR